MTQVNYGPNTRTTGIENGAETHGQTDTSKTHWFTAHPTNDKTLLQQETNMYNRNGTSKQVPAGG